MDRLIEFLNFLILATNAGSIDWIRNEGELNSFSLMDPDTNEAVIKIAKGELIKVHIIGPKHSLFIDWDLLPSLKDKIQELYDTVRLSIAWDRKREELEEIFGTIDSLILRLG